MKKDRYMLQLDSLRTLAVAGVAWHHWTPVSLHLGLPWYTGVNLFFVLSGFLITGILLDCRWPGNRENPDRGFSIRRFYIRRFLRIFPLYYLVLLVTFVLNIEPVRRTIAWHLLYASNFYFVHHGGWHGPISHFWSLSVEEQFYIFWPFLVLFTPRKALVPAVLGLILAAPVFRTVMAVAFPRVAVPYVLAVANFDSLGMGALLALLRHPRISFRPAAFLRRRRRAILTAAMVLTAAVYVIARRGWIPAWFTTIESTFLAVVFAGMIHSVSGGLRGVGGKILGFRPFLYLGKISYGLYIFHNLAVFALVPTVNFLGLPQPWLDVLPFRLALLTFWTVAPAALSWHLYESPINSLKRKFPYHTKPAE